jgi:hypothetical protein
MSTVVIKLHSFNWHSPAFLRRLHEHAKEIDPEIFKGRPRPTE